jgi:peptide/nickel transport system substrate-binding protein
MPNRFSRRDFLQIAGTGALAATSAVALGACGSSGSSTTTTTTSPASTKPKRGGTLNAALIGGTASDTLDGNAPVETLDLCRVTQLYNTMVALDTNAQIQNVLVEEFTPNADATVWTMRLRSDVTFHNGKPLTADDLMFTLQRIADPKAPQPGASTIAPCDVGNMKKLDNLTVSLPCKTPYATFIESLAGYFLYFNIVPVGYDPKHPVGTGPFKFKEFVPGTSSTFVRNENYFQSPYPYFDEVIISDFSDETSQVNALLSGSTDVVNALSAASIATIGKSGSAKTLISKGGGVTPFTMRVDVAPFSDVRVRQALRLSIDRPQMLKLVFDGYGLIGNDISSIYDPEYDKSIPQREQDIDQAKSLLRAAGQEGLTVQLVTAALAQGTTSAATVMAQQASAAGITINLRTTTVTEFYGKEYLSWPFAQDFWYYTPYLPQVVQAFLPTSPYNESHFNDPHYTDLYNQASATLDSTKRADIAHEMQMIDYTQGGWIVPYYPPIIDGFANDIHGVVPSLYGESLGNFGFDKMWRS